MSALKSTTAAIALLVTGVTGPALADTQLDVLFVIDNSHSMHEEQEALTANFSAFVSTLEASLDTLPDIHIAAVTTDLGAGPYGIESCVGQGDAGMLHNPGIDDPDGTGCPENPFIESVANTDGTRTTNYRGTLDEAFQCIATVGMMGCGFEMPLEAARRALDGRNTGFLRQDAFLLIVFVSDEDDCSVSSTGLFDTSQDGVDTDLGYLNSYRCTEFGLLCDGEPPVREVTGTDTCTVDGEELACVSYGSCEPRVSDYFHDIESTYIDPLVALKNGDASKLIVASVVGEPGDVVTIFEPNDFRPDEPPEPKLKPACENANGKAVAGVRLAWFASQFGASVVPNICDDASLSETLTAIGTTTAAAILGNPNDDDEPRDDSEEDVEEDEQPAGDVSAGCQIGASGTGPVWIVLMIGALLLRRRRRRA